MSGPVDRVERLQGLTFYVGCALVFFFLLSPILVIIPLSVTSDNFLVYPLPGLSLRWYADFLWSGRWLPSLYNSIVIGGVTMVISTVLGTLTALGLQGLGPRWRRAIGGLVILPIVVPVVVTASSFYMVLGPLRLTSTFTGVILSHCIISTPFVVITVGATLRGFDHRLTRAAISLGASPAVAFRRVMLPLILPGVISGALFAFVTSFDEVITTLLIGGPGQRTLPLQMFDGIRENLRPTLTAVATVLIVISVLVVACVEMMRRLSARAAGSPT